MWALLRIWRFILLVLLPIVLLPIAFLDGDSDGESNKFKCAYVIVMVSVFWMLEVIPLAITALLPVVLFPFLGIQSTGNVVQNYMRETSMMFVGGISLALGIQYSGLHKRIALKTMIVIGSSPWRLLLGILVTTMLLSCVIVVNTAVAAMMIPIVAGVIECLEDTETNETRKERKKLYFLAVGYAANIGGTATIIGSQPNLIYKELIAQEHLGQDGKYTDLNFVSFIAFSMPIAIMNLLLTWIILGSLYLGLPRWSSSTEKISFKMSDLVPEDTVSQDNLFANSSDHVARLLRRKLDELGNVSFHEWAVVALLSIAVILWLFREPQVFPGWFSLFPEGHPRVGDSSVAVAILILMFIVPKEIRYFHGGKGDTVLSWSYIQQHFPWNVIFLVGGGLAISDGANASGLSIFLGDKLNGLESLPRHIILLIILIVISLLTEMMSNAATISLLTPILIALSKRLDFHPLYLSLPGAIACQYAFMLPTANPPNAIVFTAGDMQIKDTVKPGVFLNFACIAVLYLMNITWGEYVIFKYKNYEYPQTIRQNQ